MIPADKVFFLGLGGAGQRHMRIFRKLLPRAQFTAFRHTSKTPLLNPDFSVNRTSSIEETYQVRFVDSIHAGLREQPNFVVISTPTAFHMSLMLKAARQKVHIFVEKPPSHNCNQLARLESNLIESKLGFFVAYQRRFHPLIQKAKELILKGKLGTLISADFHTASYLPHWHPYENFRELYACRKEMGGGVLLTESHEIDLCCWIFGKPSKVTCFGGNFSNCKMDVEDTAQAILCYPGFSAIINLSFMQKRGRREFHIFGSRGCLEWTEQGNELRWTNYDSGHLRVFKAENLKSDDLFLYQARYFLNHFKPTDRSYLESAKILLWVLKKAKASLASPIPQNMN